MIYNVPSDNTYQLIGCFDSGESEGTFGGATKVLVDGVSQPLNRQFVTLSAGEHRVEYFYNNHTNNDHIFGFANGDGSGAYSTAYNLTAIYFSKDFTPSSSYTLLHWDIEGNTSGFTFNAYFRGTKAEYQEKGFIWSYIRPHNRTIHCTDGDYVY